MSLTMSSPYISDPEPNIPIPKRVHGRPSRFPFAEMGVGDSFFVSVAYEDIRNTVRHWSKAHKVKFVCRAVVEEGMTGTRVWRTE